MTRSVDSRLFSGQTSTQGSPSVRVDSTGNITLRFPQHQKESITANTGGSYLALAALIACFADTYL